MTRTLQEQLIKNGLARKPIKKQIEKSNKEQLSKRELEELMGMRRPTYRRKNGAFRQS